VTDVLVVRDLEIRRRLGHGWTPIVDGVGFALSRGEILGVCGESGSGKTLTSLSIVGLVPAGLRVTGSIRYSGEELVGAGSRRLRSIRGKEIAVVWQDPSSTLHPLLNIGTQLTEHVRYHLGFSERQAHERALELLAAVRVPDPASALTALPHEFSGGMRQRIGIAIALACDPQILLADEPTTALDVTVQAGILRLLVELVRGRGLSLVLISHDLGVMSAVTDRLQVMYAGRIVESGPTSEVIAQPRHPYTSSLLAVLPRTHAGGARMQPIGGSPPVVGRLPGGCAFHPRCPYAEPSCVTQSPPLVSIGAGRALACPVDPFARALEGL
jgi:oligopeptide/dipeptide ABC transporter ATP-binding protein